MKNTPDNDVLHAEMKNGATKKWFAWTVVVVAFLALAVTGIQEWTLQNEEVSGAPREFAYRFLMSYTLFSAIFLLFHRYVLYGVLMMQTAFFGSVLLYFSYFRSPLRISSVIGQFFEGVEAGGSVLSILSWQICLFLPIFFGVPFILLLVRARCRPIGWRYRTVMVGLCLVVFSAVLFMQFHRSSFNQEKSNIGNLRVCCNHTGSLVAQLGYLPVMLHDLRLCYGSSDQREVLEQAVGREVEQSDRLREEFLPPGRPENIVVVQVEALDYAALNYRHGEKEITPFLNRLASTSLSYRILANHEFGSATADFVFLNGIPPSEHLLNYSLDGFPYNTSIVDALLDGGYRTHAVHGVRGSFFNRRPAFEKMKFENIHFRREIRDELQKETSAFRKRIGEKPAMESQRDKWLKDYVVFEYGNFILERNPGKRNFLFLITATSHHPYENHYRREIVPDEKDIGDRYMNAINGLDADLERFYAKLPEGTLVVVYGDHSSCIWGDDFPACIEGNKEYVPLIISVKGKTVAQRCPAFDGDAPFDLRDLHSYIRRTALIAEPLPDRNLMQAAETSIVTK